MIALFVVASVLVSFAHTSAVPSNKQIRSGRFLAFDSDDAFLDLLDEMQDPLPVPESSNSQVFYEDTEATSESFKPKPKPTRKHEPTKNLTENKDKNKEKIVVYNHNTGKFEVVNSDEAHVTVPNKPVTENGVFFFGGQHYQIQNPNGPPTLPQGNKTEEIKIFWSSVGDAIENIPFLPIQVNVPDMLSAMATFLSNSIPLINRIRNPNEPRPIMKPVQTESGPGFYNNNYLTQGGVDRIDQDQDQYEDVEYRRLGTDSSVKETKPAKKEETKAAKKEENKPAKKEENKPAKKEEKKPAKKQEGKSELGEKGSLKRIFKRPVRPLRPLPSTTEELVKIWHGSQSGESAKIKNMPITRKKFHVADREFFNFKNSDISNSPIMILNMPSRPMMYYKIKHHHVSGEKEQVTMPPRPIEAKPQPQQPQNATLKISRRRKLRKEIKKAAKKVTRRAKPNQRRRQ